MESRRAPEYTIEISADRSSVKEVVKGILHVIFFHRFFTPLRPAMHDVLDSTLPYVQEQDIETLIDAKTNTLLRQLDSAGVQMSPQYQQSKAAGRAQLALQFLEKKRRRGWFVAKADEETVWETWYVELVLTTARSEPEAARNRRQMERQLHKAVLQIVNIVNRDRGHIPPITTNDTNPFPYQITVNPKLEGGSNKLGMV